MTPNALFNLIFTLCLWVWQFVSFFKIRFLEINISSDSFLKPRQ